MTPSFPRSTSPSCRLTRLVGGLMWLALCAACNNQDQVVVPNRVLDRPTDVALGCVKVGDDGRVQVRSTDQCGGGSIPSCSSITTPQLIGFVANSEKNEVAMWRRCDTQAGIVDLDDEAPGYQLLPVGSVPSAIVSTGLGCRAVTANFGSCDMSVIDARQMGAYALDLVPEVAPSELVWTLVPRTADGEPLASRPHALLSIPDRLSQAAPLGDGPDDEGMPGEGDDGDDTGGIDDPEGTDGDPEGGMMDDTGIVGEFSLCPRDKPESVYVTFPACQLVAEVSLNSQRILQSRRFVTLGDGTVVIEDAGSSPLCPIECPAQFDGTLPMREVEADPHGFFPSTLELIQPIPEDLRDPEFGDEEVRYSALYVGGLGSDQIFELRFERGGDGSETGAWLPPGEVESLTLHNAKGVHAIRATPPTLRNNGFPDVHQFLYVVAGDGSTRVVDRDFDEGRLGVECDTQRDPTLVNADDACVPVDPGTVDSPDRRPFAVGPGIRASSGAAINDWTFQRVNREQAAANSGSAGEGVVAGARTPFGTPGVVGVGVTSFGRVVFSTIEQFVGSEAVAESVDPVGIMSVSLNPHTLWPSVDPTVLNPEITALPRLDDIESDRAFPGPDDRPQELAPALRLIDVAYAKGPGTAEVAEQGQIDVSAQQRDISANLGDPENIDQLGSFSGESGLYENNVARVAVRDYQTWSTQAWSFLWEGSIPGTRSPTGRIVCETPGWEGGTCAVRGGSPERADDIQLVDESATFCDQGVLPGDKLVLIGCAEDEECGLGQRCLTEPTAPANAGGICVSADAFENDFELLRAACAPFIDDPCGEPRREYLISRAFQDRVHLQLLDIPKTAHLSWGEIENAPQGTEPYFIEEREDRYTCRLPTTSDAVPEPIACSEDSVCPEDWICSNDGVCRGPCADGEPGCRECQADADCFDSFGDEAICSDGLCRRPCSPGDPDCILMPLPGPRCFAELTDYVVRVRNSFIVQGEPQAGFLTDRVFTDPVTGECREDTTVSSLLTSRLRLGEDELSTWEDPEYPIEACPNPDEAAPGDPNPCRIGQARELDDTTLFHYFSYKGQPVEAVRFSNPFASFVLDLVSLRDLADEVAFIPEAGFDWPTTFARFKRSRIPVNYRETITTQDGYIPYNEPVIVSNVPMVYPVRIIDAPENGVAFIVDAGGRGGVAGVRGQIIRINAAGVSGGAIGDESFRVR